MRRDAALLAAAGTPAWPAGAGILRLYQWQDPTLSLGYFQDQAAVAGNPRWQGLPIVRRLSGGGAILHDHEWTYSLTLADWSALVQRPHQLYAAVHHPIVDFLASAGVAARLRGITTHQPEEPELCFFRADENDIVIGERKILGSAQRRRKGGLLQHGSLIIEQSTVTPEIMGLLEVGGLRPAPAQRESLARSIAESISENHTAHHNWPPALSSLLAQD